MVIILENDECFRIKLHSDIIQVYWKHTKIPFQEWFICFYLNKATTDVLKTQIFFFIKAHFPPKASWFIKQENIVYIHIHK